MWQLLTHTSWISGVLVVVRYVVKRVYDHKALKLGLQESPGSSVTVGKTSVTPKPCSCQKDVTEPPETSNVAQISDQRKEPPEISRSGTG